MYETLWAAEPAWLEQYLTQKAEARNAYVPFFDIPAPGSEQAIDEIYSRQGEIAHIRIEGPLSVNGPDALDKLFDIGGTSYKTIISAINRAKTDPLVKSVVLDINSPGGTVEGVDETWQAHKNLAVEKPTEVKAGSLLASAAYYLASPANKIFVAAPTSQIGSIGVIATVYDTSGLEEKIGVKRVKIISKNAPLKNPDAKTEEGYNAIQNQLDAVERIFYSRISEGRKVSVEHIAENFGKGGLLVAADPSQEHNDAMRAGMIDGVMNINVETPPQGEAISPAQAGTKQERHMTLSEFLKENPAAVTEIDKLKSEAKEAGRAEANADYSARIEAILPILTSEAYPSNIKALAKDAFKGGEGMAAFKAGVSVYDAQVEKAKSDQAKEETQKHTVSAEMPDMQGSADKQLDAALQAELEKRRSK